MKAMGLLTSEDVEHFKREGFILKHDTLTQDQIEAAVETIWDHMEVDRDDPSSWIGGGPVTLPCGSEPAISATLNESELFAMAEELVGKNRIARPAHPGPHMNYPTGKEWSPPESGHLDGYYTPTNGVPQGTVGKFFVGVSCYINDIEHQGGGFTIWPGTHIQAEQYFKTHSMLSIQGGGARDAFDLPPPFEVTGPAGTACLWHGRLVHSASQNSRDQIRMALISRLRPVNLNDILFETPDDMWEHWDGVN